MVGLCVEKYEFRTDLACERFKLDENEKEVEYREEKVGSVTINELKIKSETEKENHGIRVGKYTTLHFPALYDASDFETEEISSVLSKLLRKYLLNTTKKETLKGATVIVVGLGNRYLTADAIGPLAIKEINATMHISKCEKDLFEKHFFAKVVTLATGVTAQTGMESADILSCVCKKVKPDAIIVIDALAARSYERLATTIQICDTGITPGSGIGNSRCAFNCEIFGCPVIAIGVPTVVESATLVFDVFEKSGEKVPPKVKENLLRDGFFVSPKDCDAVTLNASKIISAAINSVLNESLYE